MNIDYHEILGLQKTATKEEIKKAYRTLSKKYHPDVNDAANASVMFRLVEEAYQSLYNDNIQRDTVSPPKSDTRTITWMYEKGEISLDIIGTDVENLSYRIALTLNSAERTKDRTLLVKWVKEHRRLIAYILNKNCLEAFSSLAKKYAVHHCMINSPHSQADYLIIDKNQNQLAQRIFTLMELSNMQVRAEIIPDATASEHKSKANTAMPGYYAKRSFFKTAMLILLRVLLFPVYILVAFLEKIVLLLGALASGLGWLAFGACILGTLIFWWRDKVFDSSIIQGLIASFACFIFATLILIVPAIFTVIKTFLQDFIFNW